MAARKVVEGESTAFGGESGEHLPYGRGGSGLGQDGQHERLERRAGQQDHALMVSAQRSQRRVTRKGHGTDLFTVTERGDQQVTQQFFVRAGPEGELQPATVGLDSYPDALPVQVEGALPYAGPGHVPGQGRDLQSHGSREIGRGFAGQAQCGKHRCTSSAGSGTARAARDVIGSAQRRREGRLALPAPVPMPLRKGATPEVALYVPVVLHAVWVRVIIGNLFVAERSEQSLRKLRR
ncbi:hypothetical protein [Dactylosporangium cerinum]